jgi:hypothetical protein
VNAPIARVECPDREDDERCHFMGTSPSHAPVGRDALLQRFEVMRHVWIRCKQTVSLKSVHALGSAGAPSVLEDDAPGLRAPQRSQSCNPALKSELLIFSGS